MSASLSNIGPLRPNSTRPTDCGIIPLTVHFSVTKSFDSINFCISLFDCLHAKCEGLPFLQMESHFVIFSFYMKWHLMEGGASCLEHLSRLPCSTMTSDPELRGNCLQANDFFFSSLKSHSCQVLQNEPAFMNVCCKSGPIIEMGGSGLSHTSLFHQCTVWWALLQGLIFDLSKKEILLWITTSILLHPIPKSVNHLMTARAQNSILLVHKQQDPCIKQHFPKGVHGKVANCII